MRRFGSKLQTTSLVIVTLGSLADWRDAGAYPREAINDNGAIASRSSSEPRSKQATGESVRRRQFPADRKGNDPIFSTKNRVKVGCAFVHTFAE